MSFDDIFEEAEVIDLSKNENFPCKWIGCTEREHKSLAKLVCHLTNTHLSQYSYANPGSSLNVKYACQWEGCQRIGSEQPSRFALISHCRTHTGEKPFFCPIPECEKHFTRLDALTKHVKGVHDLHIAKDALFMIKERTKKTRAGDHLNSIPQNTTEEEYIEMIDKDYNQRLPWWFSKLFLETNKQDSYSLEEIINTPLPTQQYRIARERIESYVNDDDDSSNSQFILGESDYNQALASVSRGVAAEARASSYDLDLSAFNRTYTPKEQYKVLKERYLKALKLNYLVNSKLEGAVKMKRKLWLACQLLLDANVSLGLPPDGSNDYPKAENYEDVTTDIYDAALLK